MLKMKNTSLKIALIAFITVSFFSCRKDKETIPVNEITDSQGLDIQLNWSMNDGSDAIAGANLNFYIYKGVGPSKEATDVLNGSSSTSFEDKNFFTMPDGEYTLEIYYSSIVKDGKFNLILKGSEKTYSLNDNNFTTTKNNQAKFDFVRITKSGTKYTITKLDSGKSDSQITDTQGLHIQLNWSLNDASDPFTNDLDFYVYKGAGASKENNTVASGGGSSSFENDDLLNGEPDGEYTLDIEYYNVAKSGKFNVVLNGIAGSVIYSLNSNNFTVAGDGARFDLIKITKAGTKYTITKLF
jgi:hypothetical protein